MTLRTSSVVTTRCTPGTFCAALDVDRLDAAVRDRAAEDLAVQHAGQPHGVGVFGAPGDLFARLEPRQRAADLRRRIGGWSCRCHQWRSVCAPCGLRTARADIDAQAVRACRRPSRARRAMISASAAAASPARASVLTSAVAAASACLGAGETRSALLGRGADHDARGLDRRAFRCDRDRDAERRPVVAPTPVVNLM